MSRAERAIIMAAGKGQRMRPVTLATPKPLVSVNGVRMIDSVISALHENGIYELYVVVGYLGEQFSDLPARYPGLTLIQNPDWDTANNISSLYYARDHIANAIILDGDQLVHTPSILHPTFDRSGYLCHHTTAHTDEWLLQLDADNAVVSCSRTGGENGWQLYSASFWTVEDAARLRAQLELEYVEKQNRQIYWDDVALFCHPEDYRLTVRPIGDGDLVEIDSLAELQALDESYR